MRLSRLWSAHSTTDGCSEIHGRGYSELAAWPMALECHIHNVPVAATGERPPCQKGLLCRVGLASRPGWLVPQGSGGMITAASFPTSSRIVLVYEEIFSGIGRDGPARAILSSSTIIASMMCGVVDRLRRLERRMVLRQGRSITRVGHWPEVVIWPTETPDPAYRSCFRHTRDRFPSADLLVCLDVLFTSFAHIWKALENFGQSDVAMMLVTTHTDERVVNRDIWTGDFRLVDLFKPPFSLPPAIVLERFPDYAEPLPARDMVLIRREDLAQHLRTRC